MAPYAEFREIFKNEKTYFTHSIDDEYVRFGNHVYVLRQEVDIKALLCELGEHGEAGGKPKIQHLHVYCQRLQGDLSTTKIRLRICDGGYSLRSLHIFAAEIAPFSEIAIESSGKHIEYFSLNLHYDIESGSKNFWIGSDMSVPHLLHVSRDQQPGMGCTAGCSRESHFSIPPTRTVGLHVSMRKGTSTKSSLLLESIESVHQNELRLLQYADFEQLGSDRPRLQNLPRLLDALFSSAGKEIMTSRPKTTSILAKLRFIKLCAGNTPHMAGLVKESDVLMARLELPRALALPEKNQNIDDILIFHVPKHVPRALVNNMEVNMDMLNDANAQAEIRDEMQSVKDLIHRTSGAVMEGISQIVGIDITNTQVDSAEQEASKKAIAATKKMDDLRMYQSEMDRAERSFKNGIEKHKKDMQAKLEWEIFKGVLQVGASIAAAVYSGGAAAPLTVGAMNKLLATGKAIEQASKLSIALKTLLKASAKIVPQISAAFKNHSDYTNSAIGKSEENEGTTKKLERQAKAITDRMVSSSLDGEIDFAGLLADWRDLDLATDRAFSKISEELGTETVDGLDDYHLSLKKLVIRGRALLEVLRESSESRKKFMLLVAEKASRQKSHDEISRLQKEVSLPEISESVSLFVIKYRSMLDFNQRRRVIFNMLHEGILSLIYHTNNPKLGEQSFSNLSPSQTASQLSDYWVEFKKEINMREQTQSGQLCVTASEICPLGWQDLIVNDLEIPFHIPLAHPELDSKHHMRMSSIYVNFTGLVRQDGTTQGLEKFNYKIFLGPIMVDRNSAGTTLHYYMNAQPLDKSGKDGKLVDDDKQFAKAALCCSGRLRIPPAMVKLGWNLATIQDLEFRIKYETLTSE